ncbi:MAG: DUF2339 domain-containing protein, partial [Nanoarchaeota archaeon]
ITYFGILGIIIGITSFFFYAVANDIIGETAQIGIGIVVGLILFVLSYKLRERNILWSNVVFGGAYFIELLTVGVGVQVYENIPMFAGISLLCLFLISSVTLSVKFSSRTIAYFSLVGGYFIPIIVDMSEEILLIGIFYLIIASGLLVLSIFKDWPDHRLSSLAVLTILSTYLISKPDQLTEFIVAFWIVVFIFYNAASLWASLTYKTKLPILDSIIIGLLPIILMSHLFGILEISSEYFGLIFMALSLFYLGGIGYLKQQQEKIDETLRYTLFSAGAITLNLGFVFLLVESFGSEFLMIFFLIEWLLLSVLKHKVEEEKLLFSLASYVFLFLTILWFFMTIGYDEDFASVSLFLVLHLAIPVGFFLLYNKIKKDSINGAGFIISGYIFILSLSSYIGNKIISSSAAGEVILSVSWLLYTLILFSKIKQKNARILIGVLLGFTLLKIAFKDLLYLEGIYRIIGFTIFGILLLIGGYFLKNESIQN